MTSPRKIKCPWCGLEMDDDPGSYYHQKDCEASHWRREIKKAEEELKVMRKKLEMAEFVGD